MVYEKYENVLNALPHFYGVATIGYTPKSK